MIEGKNGISVSVIVPVYNCEGGLPRCVESLRAQTLKEIEIILVNDGSTDASAEVCARYAALDPRVRFIDKENGGVSTARNAGLEIARGEYFGFCDADDYVLPQMFERLYAAAKREGADVCVCDFTRADEVDAAPVKEGFYKRPDAAYHVAADPHFCGYVWNKLFLRSKFGEARFDERLRCCQDLYYTAQIIVSAERVYYLAEKLYMYGTPGAPNNLRHPSGLEAIARSFYETSEVFHRAGCLRAMFRQSVEAADSLLLFYGGRLRFVRYPIDHLAAKTRKAALRALFCGDVPLRKRLGFVRRAFFRRPAYK